MNAPYNITTGDKQYCREALVSSIKRYCPKTAYKSFFLLPSEEAHDAYLLQKHWPKAKIVCVERDPDIHTRANRKHPFHVENESVASFTLQQRNIRFDSAFLDYMGVADRDRMNEIAVFVNQYAADHFVLGLTFSMNARNKLEELSELVREYGVLTEEEEKAATFNKVWINGKVPSSAVEGVVWNTAENVMHMVCGFIDSHTRGFALEIIDCITYKARDRSSFMHFGILYIRRVS
jgi:hypothetical protein